MRFAYSDPPYLGQGKRYVAHHPDALLWDKIETHAAHIEMLCATYPDGWAMSCSSPSLRHLLPLCPDDCRIGPWVKPFHVYKKGVRPAYAWEPVIYRGGRNKNHPPPPKGGKATTPKDFLVESDPFLDEIVRAMQADEVVIANITLRRGLTGAKPEKFCFWIFDLLGMRPDDEFHDLFPGTGAVTDAWEKWRAAKTDEAA
jgi:hypothetical protein